MMIRKDVLKLTGPIILEQSFIMLMGVMNAILAGRIGSEAVSAIGMVDSLNNVFISFFSALAVGGTVVVAHYAGQRNISSANEATKQVFFSGLMLSTSITLAIWIFRNPVLNMLYGSAEETVMQNAHIYLNITLLTYPLIALTSIACGVLRGAGDTGTPMKVTILMNVLNFVLSYVFIYGVEIISGGIQFGIPAMGIRGAAIGIALARIIGASIVILILLRGSKIIQLIEVHKFKFKMDIQRSIFGIGMPASVESLLFTGGKLITQIFIVGMGTASIAANYIAGNIASFINIPGSALSIAATTFVGQYMGRGDSDGAKDTLMYLLKLSSVCLTILCVLAIPFAGPIAALYTKSDEVIEITKTLVRVFALCVPLFWSPSFLLPAGLKGAGDAKYTMATSIFSMWAFRITLGYVLGVPLGFGVMGVWMGMFVDWVIRGSLFYIRLRNEKWKTNIVIKDLKEAV